MQQNYLLVINHTFTTEISHISHRKKRKKKKQKRKNALFIKIAKPIIYHWQLSVNSLHFSRMLSLSSVQLKRMNQRRQVAFVNLHDGAAPLIPIKIAVVHQS